MFILSWSPRLKFAGVLSGINLPNKFYNPDFHKEVFYGFFGFIKIHSNSKKNINQFYKGDLQTASLDSMSEKTVWFHIGKYFEATKQN